jgi:NAD-dependent deacetylase
MPAAELALHLRRATAVVAFTGAGISTESGIPDFRSPGGLWARYDPRELTFAKYVASAEVRRTAWRLRRELAAATARPNPAHLALTRLEAAGRLRAVVTQNIDGLHTDAGSRAVIELHGTARQVRCIGHRPRAGTPDGCGFTESMQWALAAVDAGDDDPACPGCGGLLKSATVSFGQNLHPGVLQAAEAAIGAADLVVAIGSSLQVHPAAGLPAAAARAGIPLVIVNDESTPLDEVAAAVVRGRAAQVLPPAVDAVLAVAP